MAARNSAVAVGKQIRTLFDAGALRALPDRGLLDQFAAGGETVRGGIRDPGRAPRGDGVAGLPPVTVRTNTWPRTRSR